MQAASSWGVVITIRLRVWGKIVFSVGDVPAFEGEHFFRPLWTNKQFNFFIVLINLIKLTSKVC